MGGPQNASAEDGLVLFSTKQAITISKYEMSLRSNHQGSAYKLREFLGCVLI